MLKESVVQLVTGRAVCGSQQRRATLTGNIQFSCTRGHAFCARAEWPRRAAVGGRHLLSAHALPIEVACTSGRPEGAGWVVRTYAAGLPSCFDVTMGGCELAGPARALKARCVRSRRGRRAGRQRGARLRPLRGAHRGRRGRSRVRPGRGGRGLAGRAACQGAAHDVLGKGAKDVQETLEPGC